ncbi:hypothetical protein GMRT_11667 [Giardia muris]|uniref:Uncharacterized protein n=1 Tax=Giardia muris TaxID=5742 RepID=A0A4Z1TAJ4_GIAMU|nr:hypothetical protein GMRT_11667 [Giardia muris]|eukprot:TNJ29539.1 hypothetical protein GMRT_11667 [Giardia muris]
MRFQTPLTYSVNQLKRCLEATLEVISQSDTHSPVRLVLTSSQDPFFHFSCDVTNNILATMCSKIFLDTLTCDGLGEYLRKLVTDIPECRSIRLTQSDPNEDAVFLISDRLDTQSFLRFTLPFRKASIETVATHLATQLEQTRTELTSTQATLQEYKARVEKESYNFTERLSAQQQELQTRGDESRSLKIRIGELENELQTEKAQRLTITQSLTDELGALKKVLIERTELQKAAETKAQELHSTLMDRDAELKLLRSEHAVVTDNLAARSAELEALKLEYKAMEGAYHEADRKLCQLSAQCTSFRDREETSVRYFQEKVEALERDKHELTESVAELREAAGVLSAELQQLSSDLHTTTYERDHARAELTEVVGALKEALERAEELASQVATLKTAEQLFQEQSRADKEKADKIGRALAVASKKYEDAQKKCEELTTRVRNLENQLSIATAMHGDELYNLVADEKPTKLTRRPDPTFALKEFTIPATILDKAVTKAAANMTLSPSPSSMSDALTPETRQLMQRLEKNKLGIQLPADTPTPYKEDRGRPPSAQRQLAATSAYLSTRLSPSAVSAVGRSSQPSVSETRKFEEAFERMVMKQLH